MLVCTLTAALLALFLITSVVLGHADRQLSQHRSTELRLGWGVSTDDIQGLFGQQPSSRQNHAYQLAKRALLQRSHWQQTQALSSSLSGDRAQPRVPNKATRDLKALIKGPHTWPGYFLDDTSRQMGVDYRGDMGRLRNAFARYQATGNLSVVVVGGSISAGAGAVDTHSWVEYLEDWLALHFNATRDLWRSRHKAGPVHLLNSAVPGTYSSYMSVCYNVHVPKTADIIIVEYSLNDAETLSETPFDNSVRRPFERLLRKLLSYPNKPAVLLLNAYTWFDLGQSSSRNGLYYTGSDREFHELATYYQLPTVGVKNACWRSMAAGVPGFNVSRTRGDVNGATEAPEIDAQLKGNVFYWDVVHPEGHTGHRAMADLAVHLLADAARAVTKHRHYNRTADLARAAAPLPPPMIPGNWESTTDKCFIGDMLQAAVLPPPTPAAANTAFQWLNDQPPHKRAKWGLVATQPGATIEFKIDTSTPAKSNVEAAELQDYATVEVAHLRSYQGMGQASLECVSGCSCKAAPLNGHHSTHTSLVALHEVVVSQSRECVLRVTVLPDTSDPGGGHKVKITGLMISDESGVESSRVTGLQAFSALGYVADGMRPNGTFEIRHTWAHVSRR
ncbi:hypothetical protein V8C86DRAFT_2753172 [Haematococcus lacustris]